jgi:hypothetical protein
MNYVTPDRHFHNFPVPGAGRSGQFRTFVVIKATLISLWQLSRDDLHLAHPVRREIAHYVDEIHRRQPPRAVNEQGRRARRLIVAKI